MNYTKEQILAEINKLYEDIDRCIDDLLDARLTKNEKKELITFDRMEGLMVGVQQDLTVFHDWIEKL